MSRHLPAFASRVLAGLLLLAAPLSAQVASQTLFVDAPGGSVTTYTLGTDRIFVEVRDSGLTTTSVTLTVIQVNRSGADTVTGVGLDRVSAGIYRGPAGGLALAFQNPPVGGNQTLEANNFDTISAIFADPTDPGDVSSDTATVVKARTTAVILFTDPGFNQAQEVYLLGRDTIRIRLTEGDADDDPATADTVQATVLGSGGDSEAVTLTETGASTGVFTGSLILQSGAVALGDGRLQAASGETLTARHVDTRYSPVETAQDTALVRIPTSAAAVFTDSSGVAKSTFSIGVDGIFVTVTDPDQDTNPATQQTVGVTVSDPSTGDLVALTLAETQVSSGVFRNVTGLTSSAGAVNIGNSVLEVRANDVVQARYVDPDDAADTVTAQATMRLAPTQATLAFTDAAGNAQFNYTIGVDRVFMTVSDADRNANAGVAETVTATLQDGSTGDQETLTLTETGVDTGIFRGPAGGLPSARVFTGIAGNNLLESVDAALITGRYTDSVNGDTASGTARMNHFTASTTRFTDAFGNTRTQYTIGTGVVFVTVADTDRNLNPNLAETLSAVLTAPGTSDSETITLTETGVNTGVFRNQTGVTVRVAAAGANGILDVVSGDTIQASYTDPHDGTDQSQATATVSLAGTASSARFVDGSGNLKTQYVIAIEGIFVEVTDADQNRNAAVAETLTATVVSSLTGDIESRTLTETGASTGVFRSTQALTSTIAARNSGDGTVQTGHQDTLTVNYTDPDDSLDTAAAFATMQIAPTASSVVFTDAAGNAQSIFSLGAGDLFVTVDDRDQDTDPGSAQTVTVRLDNANRSDQEFVVLQETGINTGIFRNAAGVASQVAGTGIAGNNRIEGQDNDPVTARYTDPDDSNDTSVAGAVLRFRTDATVRFTSSGGADVTQYVIGSDLIFVTLTDLDEGSGSPPPSTPPTIQVSVVDPVTGDVKGITLTELGGSPGTFRNTTGLTSVLGAADPNDPRLRTSGNTAVRVDYTDPDDPADTTSDTVTMKNPATVGTLRFIDAGGATVNTVTIGTVLRLELADADQNLSPLALDQLFIDVVDGATGDFERIIVTETGANTGVFRNGSGLNTRIGIPAANATLETGHGSLITANYQDPDNAAELVSAFATADLVPNPTNARTAVFTNGQGTPITTAAIGQDLLFVTVTEPDANLNAAVTDTVRVTLRNFTLVPPDTLILTLQEINPANGQVATNTGVFRNTVGVASVLASSANPGNGLIEARGSDFVTVDYQPRGGLSPSAPITPVQMVQAPAGSTTVFTDGSSNPKNVFSIGADQVFVTVTDADQNLDPGALDSFTVQVSSTITGATTSLALTETGFNNGIFRNLNGLRTSLDVVPGTFDFLFHTADGAVLTAAYTDPNDPGDTSQGQATMAVLQVPATSILLQNTAGGPAATRFEIFTSGLDEAFVRVADTDEDTNPLTIQQVQVTLIGSNTPLADTETVSLTETGAHTGIFQSTTGVRITVGPASSGDGLIQTFSGGTITARYTDKDSPGDRQEASAPVGIGPSPVTSFAFTDSAGNARSSFIIGTEPVFVTLADPNRNTNPALTESATVTLTSATTGDTLTVILFETTAASGIFRNTGTTAALGNAVPTDNVLQVAADTVIDALYVDPGDPADTATAQATMRANPVNSLIRLTDAFGNTKTRFVIITDPIFITVTDPDQNKNAAVAETLTATLESAVTNDVVSVPLTEVSPNSGEFRNPTGVASTVAPANTANAILETGAGATLTARYTDPDDPADQSTFLGRMDAPQTASQAFFIRSLGATTTTSAFAIGQQLIFARVIDVDQNQDPTRVESFQAFIERLRLPEETTIPPAEPTAETRDDQELLTFLEVDATGASSTNSSIFETVVPISSEVARITPGNGIIDAAGGSTVRLRYVDPDSSTDVSTATATLVTPFVAATLQFTDQSGTDVTTYDVGAPTGIFLTLTDSQQNRIASVRETAIASIFDSVTGSVVGVGLTELLDATGNPDTGIFRNSVRVDSMVALPPLQVTTKLFTADGALITGSYLPQGQGGPSFGDPAFDPTVQKLLTKPGPNGKSCFDCHRDVLAEANLNLTGYRDLIRGGSQTPVVTGNAAMSLLIQKIEDPAVDPLARPHGIPVGVGDPTLKVDQVMSRSDLETLKLWINQGAVAPSLPTSIAYDTIQTQIFTPACATAGCHDFGSQAGGIRLDNVSGFLDAVQNRQAAVLGNGPASIMVRALADPNYPHSGRKINGPIPISVEAVQQISEYISQQYPLRDSVPLREYTGDVQPLFDRHCVACHNGLTPQGGLNLETITGLQMGGVSVPVVNPGDVPRSVILDKIDPVADPTHFAVVPPAFFQPAGAFSAPSSILTSWINQGAIPGAAGPLAGPPAGAITDTATMKVVPTTATVAFTDVFGNSVDFYQIVNEGIYVTIVDSDRNLSPTTAEQIPVRIQDSRTLDDETILIPEVTSGSGIFRNQVAIRSEVAVRIPGDGVVQSLNNSVLTVTYQDAPPPAKTDTVVMSTNTRSQIRFVDGGGLPRGTFGIGSEPVFIEVTDADQAGKGRLDAGTVSVTVSQTGDSERQSLVMDELGVSPGVFRSQGLITAIVGAVVENGGLETIHQGVLTATYVDPEFGPDTAVTTAVTVVTPTTASVLFTDTAGVSRTTFVVLVDDIFVTVLDPNRNVSPTAVDTLQVLVRNEAIADAELLTLTELAPDSGLFRNAVGLKTALTNGPAAPGNNLLETRDIRTQASFSEVIRADYADLVSPPDTQSVFAQVVVASQSAVEFVNASNQTVSSYVRGQDPIFLRVADPDQNRSASVRETLVVTVFDDTSVDREQVELRETSVSSGIFLSTQGLSSAFGFPLPPVVNNRVLEVRAASIRAQYVDTVRNLDTSQDTALIVPKDPNDTDDDGIPDTYETANGLNPLDPTDALLDFDNDGWTNLEEFKDGTDPRNPFDRKPTASAGNNVTTDPGQIQLDGSASRDPRNLALTYLWSQVNVGLPGRGESVTFSDPRAVMPTFVGLGGRDRLGNDFSLYEFDLVVANLRVSSNPNRVGVTIRNVPPDPVAGFDLSVPVGTTLTLEGRETRDPNNEPIDVTWTGPVGIAFQGASATTLQPRVTPVVVGAHQLTLAAQDLALNARSDRVFLIAHADSDHVPLAAVEPRVTGQVNQAIAIDGSGSADADAGDALIYFWNVTRVPQGVGTLSTIPSVTTVAKTNLVPPGTGYYEVTLRVQDRSGHLSTPTTAGIVVNFPGSATQIPDTVPSADAGEDRTVTVLARVALDGSASRDAEGGALTFRWTQVGGLPVTLDTATGPVARFTPIFPGVYRFTLVVSDGTSESAPDEIAITVDRAVADPRGGIQRVPEARPATGQSVRVGDQPVTVVLDGSASIDADADPLTYFWTQVAGPGVGLNNALTAFPNFRSTRVGTYVFDLRVFDGKNFSRPARTSVQVAPLGKDAPIARAGDNQTIFLVGGPVTVTLDGRGSTDPQGQPLTFQWSQIQGIPVTLSPSAASPTPFFLVNQVGAYRFRLVVRDPFGLSSDPSDVVITVVDGQNSPPEVRLNGSGGPTATLQSRADSEVTLDASQSFSRSGGGLTYIWRQLSGPVNVVMPNATDPVLNVMLRIRGTYTFQVTVIDGRNNRSDGTLTIFVAPTATGTDSGSGRSLGSGSSGGAVIAGGGDGGGGGGGGCRAGSAGAPAPAGTGWFGLVLLWTGLLIRRRRRRSPDGPVPA